MKLRPVYAIEIMPGVFLPRSDASFTSDAPRLFARRHDCNRQLKALMSKHTKARIVVFKLTVIEAMEPGVRLEHCAQVSDPVDATA